MEALSNQDATKVHEPATPEARAIQACLNATDEVLFGFLFGSRAAGRSRPNSDWDVAIYLRENLSPRQRFDVRLAIHAELDALGRVDVVVLNDAPILLAHQALLGERLLVRDKTTYVRFFVRIMGQVEDERYWLNIHHQARLKRLREGRFGRPQRL